MANKRIKDISTASTSFASDDFVITDSATSGTRKMTKDNLISQVSAGVSGDYLEESNNLSDVASAATSRANLSVNSIAEDAEANGTKLLGPSIYLDGSNFIEVADDPKLSFTDGTNDLPFTASAWVKLEDWTTAPIISKYNSGKEWRIQGDGNDNLQFLLFDNSAGVSAFRTSDADLSAYENQWIHVCVTYGGSGPNSATAFTAAADEITLYINGAVVASTPNYNASYAGMENTSQPVWIGRQTSSYAKGHIRNVSIHNRELTAAEVADLAKGNELGFADQFGGALGGVYTQDATPSGEWSGSAGTDADEAGPVGGRSNILKFTNDGTLGQHLVENTSIGTTAGKRYRVEFYYYIPSTNSNIDGLDVNDRVTLGKVGTVASATLDAWTKFSGEYVATNNQLGINALDGGASSYQDAGADDVFYIDGLTVTEIGTLADFRSERFDSSTNKWYDLANGFVGTNSGATLVGREVPVYETGTWSGVYTPSTGSFATMTMDTDLVYTRIGNICTVTGVIQTDDVDATGASGSLRIDGLPFEASKVSVCQIGYAWAWGVNYPISGAVSGSSIYLYQRTSSTARTDDMNVTDLTTGSTNNRNVVYISATYKIQ